MAKLGTRKPVGVHDKVAKHPDMKDNPHVPGKCFEIKDPSERLLAMVAGGFFNEARYYESERTTGEFYKQIRDKGTITETKLGEDGLNEQARNIVTTAIEIANRADNTEWRRDLLAIANWLRNEMNNRTAADVLLAIAAHENGTKQWVKEYTPKICRRPDDVFEVFGAFWALVWNYFNESNSGNVPYNTYRVLPKALDRGLAQTISRYDEYQLLKYNRDTHPNFKDIFPMVERKTGYPVSKAMYEYLVNSKIVDAQATPMAAARAKFNALKEWTDEVPKLIREGRMTWEEVMSKFGGKHAKAAWEGLIFTRGLLGEMAITRNLRNFEQAGISTKAWDKLYEVMEAFKDSKQLPFRWFAARNEVTTTNAKGIVDLCLDKACMNIPDLPGITFMITDNSGSATGAPVSGNSKMKVHDAGNTLAAMIAKRFGRRAMVGVFGDAYVNVPFSPSDSCMAIKGLLDDYAMRKAQTESNGYICTPGLRGRYGGNGVGAGTETGLWWAIDHLTKNKIKVDRIVLASDLMCYHMGAVNCGVNMNTWFGGGTKNSATVMSMIERYKREVNPDVYVYSINLAGYQQSQFPSDAKNTALLSGWSENIFKMFRSFEGLEDVVDQQTGEVKKGIQVPPIEHIRLNF